MKNKKTINCLFFDYPSFPKKQDLEINSEKKFE